MLLLAQARCGKDYGDSLGISGVDVSRLTPGDRAGPEPALPETHERGYTEQTLIKKGRRKQRVC